MRISRSATAILFIFHGCCNKAVQLFEFSSTDMSVYFYAITNAHLMWLSKSVHLCRHGLHFYFCIHTIWIHLWRNAADSCPVVYPSILCSIINHCLPWVRVIGNPCHWKSCGHTISVYAVTITILDIRKYYSGYDWVVCLSYFSGCGISLHMPNNL